MQEVQAEDWDEAVHQMEMDNTRVTNRPDEPMPNLFNPLSLLMERFWQGKDHAVPDLPKPFAEPVMSWMPSCTLN